MSRLYFFIDGLNLYHALDHVEAVPDPKRLHRFKWASLTKLCDCYRINKKDTIVGVEWFTTLVSVPVSFGFSGMRPSQSVKISCSHK